MSFNDGYGDVRNKLLNHNGCPQCKAITMIKNISMLDEYSRGRKLACLEISKMSHECNRGNR